MGLYDKVTDSKKKEFSTGNRVVSKVSSNDLTEGKVYIVLQSHIHNSGMRLRIWIINDNNHNAGYESEYFVSLSESRRIKLKKIVNE